MTMMIVGMLLLSVEGGVGFGWGGNGSSGILLEVLRMGGGGGNIAAALRCGVLVALLVDGRSLFRRDV